MTEMQIELHGRACSCRGGSWVIVDPQAGSPCPGDKGGKRVVLSFTEWKGLGKPASVEEHADAVARAKAGNRREFDRFAVEISVRLSRLPSWRNEDVQSEDTMTEVLARGGVLVRSRMALEKGEIVQLEVPGAFRTKAEVIHVSGGTGFLRLGLRFLDSLLPDHLIPLDAQPLSKT